MKIPPIYLRKFKRQYLQHNRFLAFLAEEIQCWGYLELGVGIGNNFLEIAEYAKQAIGVDIRLNHFWNFQRKKKPDFELPNNVKLVEQTTDDFFAERKSEEQFDLVFIDADHNFKQVIKDFRNAESVTIEGGIIAIHDTFPISYEYTRPELCNDSYKMLEYLKRYPHLEVFTIPVNPGLTLVRKTL